MRQTIHILKKDIRHLWMEIALVLLLIVVFVWVHAGAMYWQSKPDAPLTLAAFVLQLLLPVSWWLLIVRAVHDENLVGDREFWPTRPYSWKSLLGAKFLFMVLFLNLPMMAAQAALLGLHGFRIGDQLAALLWNQALLTAAFFLPVAAISALTSGLAQFLAIGLAAWVGALLVSLQFSLFAASIGGGIWGPIEWVRGYYSISLAGIAAALILLWQYARRRTIPARLGAFAAVIVIGCGIPLSWTQAFALQSRFSPRPELATSVRAGINPEFQWMTRALIQSTGRDRGVQLNVPLKLSGVPGGLVAKVEGIDFALDAPGGAVWRATGSPTRQFNAVGRLISLRAPVDESFYRRIKDQPVAIRGTVYLTLYGNARETKIPFTGAAQDVPGMGRCTATGGPPAPYFLSCFWAMRPRAARVAVAFAKPGAIPANLWTPDTADRRLRAAASYSPFPADLSIDPLTPSQDYSTFAGPLDAVTISSEEPVAYVRAPLAIDGLRLAAYEADLKK